MRGRTRNGITVYSCKSGRASGCTGAEFHETEIEASLNEFIKVATSEHGKEELYNRHLQETSSPEENKTELVKLLSRYNTAQKRLSDLDGLLPDGFIENTRELKKRIDKLQHDARHTNSEFNIKKHIQNIINTIKQVQNDDAQDLTPALLVKLGLIQEITVEIVNHKSGKKIFSAAKSHSIAYSMGNDAQGRIGVYTDSHLNMNFKVLKTLPRFFNNVSPDV